MREAIERRISRRRYEKEPIPPDIIRTLEAEIERLNRASGLTMAFMEDARDAFASILKTYGMFSGVRSVFVMKGSASDPLLAEKIGYYGEDLVLTATDLDLGTCWVAGSFDRKKIAIPAEESMLCVVAVGMVKTSFGKEKFLRDRIGSSRKPARERLTNYDAAPQWAREAMEAVRLSPSALNRQRPIFHWQNGELTADLKGHTPRTEGLAALSSIDLGIAKKHFEIEAGGIFPLGQGAAFTKA